MKYVSLILAMQACLLLLTFLGLPFQYVKIAIYVSAAVVLLAAGVLSGVVRETEGEMIKEKLPEEVKLKEAPVVQAMNETREVKKYARPIANTAQFEPGLYTIASTISTPSSVRRYEEMT